MKDLQPVRMPPIADCPPAFREPIARLLAQAMALAGGLSLIGQQLKEIDALAQAGHHSQALDRLHRLALGVEDAARDHEPDPIPSRGVQH